MKAILIINPKSGKIKRKMPPILKWTFKKLEKSVIGVSTPKTTAAEIIKEVKKFVDNYPQHDDMTILVVKRI